MSHWLFRNCYPDVFSELSFKEVASYYGELRQALYEELNEIYPWFKCGRISHSDAIQADQWRHLVKSPARAEWRWVDAYSFYNRKNAFKRFDLCIKNGSNVVGLAYGEPTVSKSTLKIDIIEATPYQEYKKGIKTFEVVSRAAQYYAILLGADEVRIMNPLSKELANYYCSFGYEYVEPRAKHIGVYCSMKIEV
ncbi:MAG: hypothetical protein B0W54_18545 [Cellvibrio sp. 79]|nr:MAG: hypothetical protein B0W54_18545 [Cellvibrio sp. 79]